MSQIIHRPELISPGRRAIERLVVMLGTLINILFLLATACLWLFASGYLERQLFSELAPHDTLRVLGFLFGFGVLIFFTLLVWAQYNLRVFGRRNQRRTSAPATFEELAEVYQINPPMVEMAHACRVGHIDIIDDRLVLCVEGICFMVKEAGDRTARLEAAAAKE